MLIQPEREAFEDAYAAGRAQVMWRRMLGDLETPVSAMLKLGHGEAMSVLFDSVEGGAVRGRYSFIGLWPDAIWRAR
ncbi:MAG: anthranilate synthase component I, partial [Sphingomonadales bacterium]|nr:anthranilate synthase component I [Sphingomonadales bacterium]